MAIEISVRDLSNDAAQIVKAVCEEQAEYIIMLQDKPAAILRPITPEHEEQEYQARVAAYMAEMDALSEAIGRAWKTGLSAVEAVEEQRRDY